MPIGSRSLLTVLRFLAAVTVAVHRSEALAASVTWIPNGLPVGPADSTQQTPVIASDGNGGAFIVWEDWRSGQNTHTFAQHLTSTGEPASGWSVGGRQVSFDGYRDHPVVIADGSDGAYISDDGTATFGVGGFGVDRAYHIGSDGNPAGGWPAVGVTATGDPYGTPGGVHGDYLPSMAADGVGAVYLSWTYRDRFSENVKLIRFMPDGTNASGWPPGGAYAAMKFTFDQAPVTSCPDGSGGVYLAWSEFSAYIYVTRFSASGVVPLGWPVRVAPNTVYQAAPGVVPDGTGGVIVAWQDRRNGAFEQPYAQHILADGSSAAGWPTDGLALSAAASDAGIHRDANFDASAFRYTSIAEDGSGGAFITWTDYRDSTGTGQGDIYLQHVGGSGAIPPGWPINGVGVCTAPGDQELPTIASDGSGGAFVTWQDRRGGLDYDIYAQRLMGSGAIADGWPANGLALCTAPGDQTAPVLTAANTGDAIFAWADARSGIPQIYATRVSASGGVTGVVTSERATFGLEGLSPNPARGTVAIAFTLPDDHPATLEVLDVSGRRVAARAVGSLGAGRHVLRLAEPTLNPGLYFVRLVRGGRALTSRFSIVR